METGSDGIANVVAVVVVVGGTEGEREVERDGGDCSVVGAVAVVVVVVVVDGCECDGICMCGWRCEG